jgi:hypothetical protein
VVKKNSSPLGYNASSNFYLHHAGFLFGLFFDPEDDGNIFLRNVDYHSTDYTSLHPRRINFSEGLFLADLSTGRISIMIRATSACRDLLVHCYHNLMQHNYDFIVCRDIMLNVQKHRVYIPIILM